MEQRGWKPDIFDFTDYRVYLARYCEAARAHTKFFSFRYFASRAGTSRGYLPNIIAGRSRLGEGSVDAVARGLGLNKREAAFLRKLVRLEQAAEGAEKEAVRRELEAARAQARPYLADQHAYLYLSRWYYVAVREALGLPGVRPDPAWLAARLVPPVEAAEVEEALNLLENLELIRPEGDGWVRTPEHVEFTREETARAAYQAFHREMLRKGIEAVNLPGRRRHVDGKTLCISTRRVAELKERLETLIDEFHDDAVDGDAPPDAVYQVHVVLFPLFFASPEDA